MCSKHVALGTVDCERISTIEKSQCGGYNLLSFFLGFFFVEDSPFPSFELKSTMTLSVYIPLVLLDDKAGPVYSFLRELMVAESP